MPNSFQFVNRETKEPEKFSVIDDKLRLFLGVEPDPQRYYRGWYDGFGYAASAGVSFADMRKGHTDNDDINDPGIIEILKMLDWFEANYTINAWYSPK